MDGSIRAGGVIKKLEVLDGMCGKKNGTIKLVVDGGKVGVGSHSTDQVVVLPLALHHVARLTTSGVLVGFVLANPPVG